MNNTGVMGNGIFSAENGNNDEAPRSNGFDELAGPVEANSADFQNFLNERTDIAEATSQEIARPGAEFGGDIEETPKPEAEPEKPAEKQAPLEVKTSFNLKNDEGLDNETIAALAANNVPRDVQSIPKKYMKAFHNDMHRNKENPYQQVKVLDAWRWDYMREAFGRDLGDGLNGMGKAA